MRFSVLGPLAVSRNGDPVALGGPKQRALLAILLVHPGVAVSRDELIEAVWGEQPPSSAKQSLDTYLYRLRKVLGHDRIRREARGYRLRVEPEERDVDEFERLVDRAHVATATGDHRAAVAALDAALALWRGRAWADTPDEPTIAADARRLEEVRLTALEARIEARLALGAGRELVAELEQHTTEHPLRERLLAALMLARYRAGRQTEALDVFRTARERLVGELGLEPGPQLHELQRRILDHDPRLDAPRRGPPTIRSGRQRRSLAAVLALAALVASRWASSRS